MPWNKQRMTTIYPGLTSVQVPFIVLSVNPGERFANKAQVVVTSYMIYIHFPQVQGTWQFWMTSIPEIKSNNK